jgi:hypothetical protein
VLLVVHGGSEPQVARAPETPVSAREEQSGPALLLVRRDSRPPAPNAAAFHPRRGSELQVGGLVVTRDAASPLPFPGVSQAGSGFGTLGRAEHAAAWTATAGCARDE